MTKPNWHKRIEGMKVKHTKTETNTEQANKHRHNRLIDDIIPIIAEEMKKQREEVIDRVAYELEGYYEGHEECEQILSILQALKDKE